MSKIKADIIWMYANQQPAFWAMIIRRNGDGGAHVDTISAVCMGEPFRLLRVHVLLPLQ